MQLDEFSSFFEGSIVITNRVGGENLGGSDRYPVNQPRLSKGMGYKVSSEFNPEEYIERNKRKYGMFQADRHAFDVDCR